jgi:hypothetical protein
MLLPVLQKAFIKVKKYAILTVQIGHDDALSTELHRSDTELIGKLGDIQNL